MALLRCLWKFEIDGLQRAEGVLDAAETFIDAHRKVQVGGSVGTVKELSLFWTELVTDDKVQIIVPNGGVWGQPLRNFSVYPAPPHSGEVRFRIVERTELEPAIERVRAIVATISLG
jgi:hypothetical protein